MLVPAVAQATARTKVPAGTVANGVRSGSETVEVLLISKFFHLLSGSLTVGEFFVIAGFIIKFPFFR